MPNPPSIEAHCARYGSQIEQNRGPEKEAKKLEATTRNALGVLREEGLFAFYIYLGYRWKEGGHVIWPQVWGLWGDQAIGPLIKKSESNDQNKDPKEQWRQSREHVITLTENLNDLLLAREVTERTLIYALYGLRAESKEKEAEKKEE